MTPEALAALHARAFTRTPRPWSAGEFADLLALPSTELVLPPEPRPGGPEGRGGPPLDGFALGQIAGPEATLLTLAVDPDRRRRGLGRALLRTLEARAAGRGAEEMFLEVAADNDAAQALYAALGYRLAGTRPRYYLRAGRSPVDTLVLRRDLCATVNQSGKAD